MTHFRRGIAVSNLFLFLSGGGMEYCPIKTLFPVNLVVARLYYDC